MAYTTFSRAFRLSAALAALTSLVACADMERSISSTYDDVFGSDTPAPKTAVKNAAAAPYQDVKAAEVEKKAPKAEMKADAKAEAPAKPVVLGVMSNKISFDDAAAQPAPQTASTGKEVIDLSKPPVEEKEAAKAPATQPVSAPAPVADDVANMALLTIRFNQPHVYYDDALAKAVNEAEKAKSDVVYEVLSSMPNLSSLPADQQEKLSKRGQSNLRNVVIKMQQMGVPANRIRVANQTVVLRSQEIQVFVR